MKFSIGNNLVPHGLLPFCFLTIFDIQNKNTKRQEALGTRLDRNVLETFDMK